MEINHRFVVQVAEEGAVVEAQLPVAQTALPIVMAHADFVITSVLQPDFLKEFFVQVAAIHQTPRTLIHPVAAVITHPHLPVAEGEGAVEVLL